MELRHVDKNKYIIHNIRVKLKVDKTYERGVYIWVEGKGVYKVIVVKKITVIS